MSGVARVVTVAQNRRFFKEISKNNQHIESVLERTWSLKPDLVCLPESFNSVSTGYSDVSEVAEPLDGPTVSQFSKLARKHGTYIICPLFTKRDGAFWNSAVVLGRRGELVGVYDKIWIPTSSRDFTRLEEGVTPGGDPPTFELDFGRIGIQICFDLNFTETWQAIASQGARMIVWPSAYPGGFSLQAHAAILNCFVVSSVRSGTSKIINPCGDVLAKTDEIVEFAWQDINLDFIVAHTDFNYEIPEQIQRKYGADVRVKSYLSEGLFLVEPLKKGLSSAALLKEFKFETFKTYLDCHRASCAALKSGQKPTPQVFAHNNRPQWGKE